MAYSSFPFPPSTNLYPPASVVLTYLQDYANHYELDPYIQLRTEVISAIWDPEIKGWEVRTRRQRPGSDEGVYEESTHGFDLVIVANGHYRLPFYPTTPGLQAWLDSGRASHSAWYRNPSHTYLAGDTIMVVGAGPSGLDISTDLRIDAGKTIVHSIIGAKSSDTENGKLKKRGEIREYLDHSKGEVVFTDGTREVGIDHVVLATGYQDSFPFLEAPASTALHLALPPSVPPLPSQLYNSTYHVFPLAKHIFPLVSSFPPTSLTFIGLPYRVVPFPLVEAQTRAVLKAFGDPSILDLTQEAVEIISQYDELHSSLPPPTPETQIEIHIAKLWHCLDNDRQFQYRDTLHKFVGGKYASQEWKVPEWVKEMYGKKFELRAAWKEAERRGDAQDLVKGVGEKEGEEGVQEWVDLMRKVLSTYGTGNNPMPKL